MRQFRGRGLDTGNTGRFSRLFIGLLRSMLLWDHEYMFLERHSVALVHTIDFDCSAVHAVLLSHINPMFAVTASPSKIPSTIVGIGTLLSESMSSTTKLVANCQLKFNHW